jgi:hypothetical protein
MIIGPRAGIAVWLGAYLITSAALSGPFSMTAALASAVTAQMLAAAALLRKYAPNA